ncbi:hypothetical protein [Saccharothrix deserti]|uniref:hypothetical protein n=1 Tax=Saccharothrix deserti TaxID=2593674 RepID=UPI00131EB9C8|nr:hypothetical protein [Saccharothrix deserti]
MTKAGVPTRPGRAVKLRSWGPAMVSVAASALVTVASLAIARYDGFGSFGLFVAVQAIGVILGIPMLWGVHVSASRALATGSDVGTVVRTAVAVVAAACLLTSVAYFGLLALARDVVPLAAGNLLWHAPGLGASAALMSLAESLLRIRGRQLLASGLRLACAGGYLLAVAAVLDGGQGSPAVYAVLVTGGNVLCAVLMLIGLRRRRPTATTSPRWDQGLARTFLHEGRAYSTSQSLLALLFGFDAILLMQAGGPAAVAVYALYIGSCRRLIGVLFTDSLASVLIALLARAKASTGGRAVLRYAPRLLALVGVGTAVLVLVSLAAADALHHLVAGWVVLAAVGCTAHALVVVMFCIFTVQPALGLARVRTALTAAFLPGLALQAVAAAVGGAPGVMAAFAVLNVVLAGWFLLVIRRSTADLSRIR